MKILDVDTYMQRVLAFDCCLQKENTLHYKGAHFIMCISAIEGDM